MIVDEFTDGSRIERGESVLVHPPPGLLPRRGLSRDEVLVPVRAAVADGEHLGLDLTRVRLEGLLAVEEGDLLARLGGHERLDELPQEPEQGGRLVEPQGASTYGGRDVGLQLGGGSEGRGSA